MTNMTTRPYCCRISWPRSQFAPTMWPSSMTRAFQARALIAQKKVVFFRSRSDIPAKKLTTARVPARNRLMTITPYPYRSNHASTFCSDVRVMKGNRFDFVSLLPNFRPSRNAVRNPLTLPAVATASAGTKLIVPIPLATVIEPGEGARERLAAVRAA